MRSRTSSILLWRALLGGAVIMGAAVFLSLQSQHQQRLDQQLWSAVLWHQQERVHVLLAEGANPNARHYADYPSASWLERLQLERPPNGDCPLMDAAFWGDIGSEQDLLSHGADPSAVDAGGWTAAEHAQLGQKSRAWSNWQKNSRGISQTVINQHYAQVLLLLHQPQIDQKAALPAA